MFCAVNVTPVLFNLTTSSTSIVLTGLEPDSVFNISVTAATEAGSGPAVFLEAVTC